MFPIRIPPLRERREDIPPLVLYFVQRFAKRLRRPIESVSRESMDMLCRWPWPGNVRELQNVIERAVILSQGSTLTVPRAEFEGAPADDVDGGDARGRGARAHRPDAGPDGLGHRRAARRRGPPRPQADLAGVDDAAPGHRAAQAAGGPESLTPPPPTGGLDREDRTMSGERREARVSSHWRPPAGLGPRAGSATSPELELAGGRADRPRARERARFSVRSPTLKEQLTREKVYLEEEIRRAQHFGEIVAESSALRHVFVRSVRSPRPTRRPAAPANGHRQGAVGRALHAASDRHGRALVTVNCTTSPADLLESEWFGHERGAFTGAVSQKLGRFELAHHGTLFLDEIGDVPLELQSKLLRVLQEHEIERSAARAPFASTSG